MDSIKIETEINLETLFLSVTENTIVKLDEILNTPEVEVIEKQNIRKYQVLFKDNMNKTLSRETLIREFPSLYFGDSIQPIPENQINDYINMFIANRKNNKIASKLLELSAKVKTTGLNEDVVTILNTLSKADTVTKEYHDVSKDVLEIYKDKDTSIGFKVGVPQIDELTGGLKLGTLNTIAGWTGSFKTTWAVNVAYNAIKDGGNVLYLSLEVPKEDLMFNILSRHSYDDKFEIALAKDKLMKRELEDKDYKYLQEKVYPDYLKIPGKMYLVDETDLDNYSTYALESKFREIDKLAIKETGKGIDMVFIDHAQLLKFSNDTKLIGKETSVINQYISFFRKNAIDWIKEGRKVCMVMLSQTSREGWKDATRHEGQYKLTALAEANELERASSVVLSTYSNDSLINMNAAKVSILKSRNGRATPEPIETFVDPEYYVFGNVKGAGNTTIADFSGISLNSLLGSNPEEVKEIAELNQAINNSIDLDSIDIGI